MDDDAILQAIRDNAVDAAEALGAVPSTVDKPLSSVAPLDLWAVGLAEPEEILSKLPARYPAADRAARGAPAQEVAVTLLDHDVPAAFVPAMAVLASTEGKRK